MRRVPIDCRATIGEVGNDEHNLRNYGKAGFDPAVHQLAAYQFFEGNTPSQIRNATGGGPIIDWNLRTTVEGLYVTIYTRGRDDRWRVAMEVWTTGLLRRH